MNRVSKYEVSGSSAELAPYIADKIYREGMSYTQAAVLSVYLLALAGQYTDGVGGSHDVRIILPEGKILEVENFSKLGILKSIAGLEDILKDIYLTVPDFTLTDKQFWKQFKAIEERILANRYEQQMILSAMGHPDLKAFMEKGILGIKPKPRLGTFYDKKNQKKKAASSNK